MNFLIPIHVHTLNLEGGGNPDFLNHDENRLNVFGIGHMVIVPEISVLW